MPGEAVGERVGDGGGRGSRCSVGWACVGELAGDQAGWVNASIKGDCAFSRGSGETQLRTVGICPRLLRTVRCQLLEGATVGICPYLRPPGVEQREQREHRRASSSPSSSSSCLSSCLSYCPRLPLQLRMRRVSRECGVAACVTRTPVSACEPRTCAMRSPTSGLRSAAQGRRGSGCTRSAAQGRRGSGCTKWKRSCSSSRQPGLDSSLAAARTREPSS